MRKPQLILERWERMGWRNRLVTDGDSLWVEYQSQYVNPSQWHRDDRLDSEGWQGSHTYANYHLPLFGW